MASVIYNNQEIESLIKAPKYLEEDPSSLNWSLGNHIRANTTATDDEGNLYHIIFRLNQADPNNFTVILAVENPDTGKLFHLRRYNGPGMQDHTNTIENESFYGFHIHEATVRYQKAGKDAEHYAVQTDRFNDMESAFACMVDDCALSYKNRSQLSLDIPVNQ